MPACLNSTIETGRPPPSGTNRINLKLVHTHFEAMHRIPPSSLLLYLLLFFSG
jgi:hypothetical protein